MLIKTFGYADNSSPDSSRPNLVRIELRVERGILFRISGLSNSAARSAQARIRSALLSCGYKWPGKGITINISPASISRTTTIYDLPIALCMLAAEGVITSINISKLVFAGELGLDGTVHNSELPTVAKNVNGKTIRHLKSVISFVNSRGDWGSKPRTTAEISASKSDKFIPTTFEQISGEPSAKRKAIIAAAGNHNIVLVGPPGSGKSVLAKTIHSILPPLSYRELNEVKKLYKKASKSYRSTRVPWRAPHNSCGPAGLIGSLKNKSNRPLNLGEWSLAHQGVLFLDEWPEFSRNALESCRLPMESGTIALARAAGSIELPAQALLIAALNPCPCGRLTDSEHRCFCTPAETRGYLKKLSGPVADRFGIHLELGHERDVKFKFDELIHGFSSFFANSTQKQGVLQNNNDFSNSEKPSKISSFDYERFSTEKHPFNTVLIDFQTNNHQLSEEMWFWEYAKIRIRKAREWRKTRFGINMRPKLPRELEKFMDQGAKEWLNEFTRMSGITSRGKFQIMDVALSTSLIEGSEIISINQVAEAAESRLFDRSSWLSGAKDSSIPLYKKDVRINLPTWIDKIP